MMEGSKAEEAKHPVCGRGQRRRRLGQPLRGANHDRGCDEGRGGGRGVDLEGPGLQVKAPLPGISPLGPQCPRPPLASP